MSKPLRREFLLSKKKCCQNGCQNCPYKEEESFELEEISWVERSLIYNILYGKFTIDVENMTTRHTSQDIIDAMQSKLTKMLIPTHKIKIKK